MKNSLHGEYLEGDAIESIGFAKTGNNVRIHERANIFGVENIALGDNVRIDQFVNLIAIAPLTIRSWVHIAPFCHINVNVKSEIGAFSAFGPAAKLITESGDMDGDYLNLPFPEIPQEMRQPKLKGPVILEGHNLVAMNSCILPDCRLAIGAAVGMNSIVNNDLARWAIYLGSPARKIRDRKQDVLKNSEEIEGTTQS